jgi:hypothetical protein
VSKAAHGCELLVDGVRCQTAGFQVHAVANDGDAIEGEAWLGAIPGDKLIDRVLVHSARGGRAEAVEHCQFAMIQIRQPKHSATVIRLDFLLAQAAASHVAALGLRQIACAMQPSASEALLAAGANVRLRLNFSGRMKCRARKKTGWRHW